MARKRSIPEVQPASRLVGEAVVDPAGEELGRLEELIVDLDSGRIAYAILSLGGVPGLEDLLFPLPWSLLRLETENRHILLATERQLLARAPGFDRSHWPRMADREWGARVHEFYGLGPYWEMEDPDFPS